MQSNATVTPPLGRQCVHRIWRAVWAGLKYVLWRVFLVCCGAYVVAATLAFFVGGVEFSITPVSHALDPQAGVDAVKLCFSGGEVGVEHRFWAGGVPRIEYQSWTGWVWGEYPSRTTWRLPKSNNWPTLLYWNSWDEPGCSGWWLSSNTLVPPALILPWLVLRLRAWFRTRRRGRPGHCLVCGYDQRGNPSNRCPECGAQEPADRRTGLSTRPSRLRRLAIWSLACLALAVTVSHAYALRCSVDYWKHLLHLLHASQGRYFPLILPSHEVVAARGWMSFAHREREAFALDLGELKLEKTAMSEGRGIPGLMRCERRGVSVSLWPLVTLAALPWAAYAWKRARSAHGTASF